ncbi:MAG: hypothetical protein ACKV0T_00720 [Planctomycetales bacterium]
MNWLPMNSLPQGVRDPEHQSAPESSSGEADGDQRPRPARHHNIM